MSTSLQKAFASLSGPQLHAATRAAFIDTAHALRRAMSAHFRQVFDSPTAFITNSPRVSMHPRELQATIAPQAPASGRRAGNHPQKILAAQATGGARRNKAMEVALQARGALPMGWQVAPPQQPVPGSVDARGNWRGAWVRRLLVQLASGQGKKGTLGAFVITPAAAALHGHSTPGVWVRTAPGRARPAVVFTRTQRYRARLDMRRVADIAQPQAVFERRLRYRIRAAAGM